MTILCWSKQDKILFFWLGSLIFSLKYWNKINYIQRGMVVLVPNCARVSVLTLVIFPCSMKQILADCVLRGWCLDCGPGPASCPSCLTAAEGGGIWLETYWDEKIHKIFKRITVSKLIIWLIFFLFLQTKPVFPPLFPWSPAGIFCYFGFSLSGVFKKVSIFMIQILKNISTLPVY